jgi:hypothetical protein
MKIQEKDRFHGAALTQIVEHPSFKALNKADGKYGHYQVDGTSKGQRASMRVLMKYSTKKNKWQFTFQPDDLHVLNTDIQSNPRTYACLVCGRVTVCLLRRKDLNQVIDLNSGVAQSLTVSLPGVGASLRVRGSKGRLPHTIPHSAFPDDLFD